MIAVQWLQGIRCACGQDDFTSPTGPGGTHTLTECTPEVAR